MISGKREGWQKGCAGDEVAAGHPLPVLIKEGLGGPVLEGKDRYVRGWFGAVVFPNNVENDMLVVWVAGMVMTVPVGGF